LFRSTCTIFPPAAVHADSIGIGILSGGNLSSRAAGFGRTISSTDTAPLDILHDGLATVLLDLAYKCLPQLDRFVRQVLEAVLRGLADEHALSPSWA
jgi:hypothetical protein